MQITIATQPQWQWQIKIPSLPTLKLHQIAPLAALALIAMMVVITVVALAPYQQATVEASANFMTDAVQAHDVRTLTATSDLFGFLPGAPRH